MTQRMDQRKKSDESKDSTAVYVHYFPSGQPGVHYFGHVAIEVVAKLIFYLGILALKKDDVIPENGNALQKIRMAGLKYLSEYVAQRDLLANLPPLPKLGL